MTPEERMRLLRNEDQWTFTLPRRASAASVRTQFSPWLVSLVTIAAVAVIGVIVFSVFGLGIRSARPVSPPVVPTQTSVPTPSSTPSATPSATPTATAPATSPAAAPAQPLGGDCAALATTQQLSAAAGKAVTLSKQGGDETAQGPGYLSTTVDAAWRFATRQLGGLGCFWSTTAGKHTLSASVTLLPVGTPHLPTVNKECTKSTTMLGDSGYPDCEIVQIVNGTVLMGYVFSDSHATSLAFAQKFVTLFDTSARAHKPAKAVVATDGVWPLMVDCAAIEPGVVDGVTWVVSQAQIGYDGGAGNIVSRVSGDKKDTLYCAATPKNDAPAGTPKYLQYTVYGGGAWMLDQYVSAGLADPVDVPGFDRAALVTTSDTGLQFLVLIRGSNLLAVSAYAYTNDSLPVSAAYPLGTAMADALDRLAK
jgi:hypothetical protein